MKKLKAIITALLLVGSLQSPAFAGDDPGVADGSVTIYTRSGAIIHKMIKDQAFLDMITKDAMVFADAPLMVMHNGKIFVVRDRKMSDGKMLSDMMVDK